jgi:hypothetical protein
MTGRSFPTPDIAGLFAFVHVGLSEIDVFYGQSEPSNGTGKINMIDPAAAA